MGRKRKNGKGLPQRVYEKHGAFWYVNAENRWTRLGATMAEMYRALALLEGESKAGTMDALIARYLREITPTKSAQQQKNDRRHAPMLRQVFGAERPEKIHPADVAQFLRKRTAKVSANRERALLSHVFTVAMEWRIVEANPCIGVKRNTEKPRDRYVTHAEAEFVGKHCSPWLVRFLRMAYLTGQRQTDILAMTRQQITDDGIQFRMSKTGKKIVVEWTEALRDVARDCLAEAGDMLLFSHLGRPYSNWALQSAWRRAVNAAKGEAKAAEQPFEPFQIRDLRAKSVSDGGDKGMLAHANKDTTRRIYIRGWQKVKPAV